VLVGKCSSRSSNIVVVVVVVVVVSVLVIRERMSSSFLCTKSIYTFFIGSDS